MDHSNTSAPEAATFAFFDGKFGGAVGHNPSGTVVYRFSTGVALVGKFTTLRGTITVTHGERKKATQIGGLDLLTLSSMLLSEMVREGAR